VRVVVADRNAILGEALASAIDGVFVEADVTSTEQVLEAVERARTLAPLWSAVNCAGVGSGTRTIGRDGEYASAHDLDTFRRVIEINLIGTFNVCRLAATAMSANSPDVDGARGAIVNTASLAAFEGQVGQVAYSSSKGGVVGLTLPLTRDLSVIGVRVNCIAPGTMDTPIFGVGESVEKIKSGLLADVVFPHRFGRPDEFASLALELLTNSYMNGEVVRLDAAIRMGPK
jgi:NAD(P)-dependent dehydrogenase (short-subunit alcohol dehydrogenase family)